METDSKKIMQQPDWVFIYMYDSMYHSHKTMNISNDKHLPSDLVTGKFHFYMEM